MILCHDAKDHISYYHEYMCLFVQSFHPPWDANIYSTDICIFAKLDDNFTFKLFTLH